MSLNQVRTRALTQPTTSLPQATLRIDVTAGADKGASSFAESATLTVGTAEGNGLVLHDPTVSRYHLELKREGDGVRVLDLGSTNFTYAGAMRVERAVVPLGTELRLGHSTISVSAGADARLELHGEDALHGLYGRTPVMRSLMATITKVAQSNAAVLVVGESGTGKEVIARAVHAASQRRDAPFVTVDCGSLSPTLIASELFGHERGAFTGASARHIGAFEQAHGGTIFLDEVGELPLTLQPILLGVLERGRFRRVGGKDDIAIDARVVAATNRDLRADVNRGAFRLDLYYRLAVVVLSTPALRDHPADIPVLVERLLRAAGYTGPVEALVPQEVMDGYLRYAWPGNVRELRNMMEATAALGGAPPLQTIAAPHVDLLDLPYRDAKSRSVADFESRYLTHLMARAGGNVSHAAREADMDRNHLAELLRRHGLR